MPTDSRTRRLLPAGRERLGAGTQDLVGGEDRMPLVAQVRQHEGELAVAEAREVIARAQYLGQAVAQFVQHAPGIHMTGARIQALELVHIDHEDRDIVELAFARGDAAADRLEAIRVAAGSDGT